MPPGGRVFGTPAVPLNQRLREVSMLQKLPDNLKTLRHLEERVSRLEAANVSGTDAAAEE